MGEKQTAEIKKFLAFLRRVRIGSRVGQSAQSGRVSGKEHSGHPRAMICSAFRECSMSGVAKHGRLFCCGAEENSDKLLDARQEFSFSSGERWSVSERSEAGLLFPPQRTGVFQW